MIQRSTVPIERTRHSTCRVYRKNTNKSEYIDRADNTRYRVPGTYAKFVPETSCTVPVPVGTANLAQYRYSSVGIVPFLQKKLIPFVSMVPVSQKKLHRAKKF